MHTFVDIAYLCQLSVIGTDSPSFSSCQNLRPRRRKSPSFEHRLFFFVFAPSFRIFQLSGGHIWYPDWAIKVVLFSKIKRIPLISYTTLSVLYKCGK